MNYARIFFLPQSFPVYAIQAKAPRLSPPVFKWWVKSDRLPSVKAEALLITSFNGLRNSISPAISGFCTDHKHTDTQRRLGWQKELYKDTKWLTSSPNTGASTIKTIGLLVICFTYASIRAIKLHQNYPQKMKMRMNQGCLSHNKQFSKVHALQIKELIIHHYSTSGHQHCKLGQSPAFYLNDPITSLIRKSVINRVAFNLKQ